jgi:hypothetical protein
MEGKRMVRNIRSDGTEFDPADIRITKEMCPGIYELLDRMNGGGHCGMGGEDQNRMAND